MTTPMVTESADLQHCEAVIEKGMATYIEVGQALARIRDAKLYRDTHKTFASYVKDRWGHSRQWADMTIDAAFVVLKIADATPENDNHGCQKLPATERVARALSKAPPEQQAEVWAEVVEEHGEKVTAAKVAEAVEKRVVKGEPVEEPEEFDLQEWVDKLTAGVLSHLKHVPQSHRPEVVQEVINALEMYA